MRRLPVMGMVSAIVAFAAGTGTAAAGPFPPPPCSFALTPLAAGNGMVSVSVISTGCAALAAPYSSVACLQAADDPATTCSQGQGADPALVTLAHRPGVAYTASGRGCAGWVGLPPAANCQILGPVVATL